MGAIGSIQVKDKTKTGFTVGFTIRGLGPAGFNTGARIVRVDFTIGGFKVRSSKTYSFEALSFMVKVSA